MVCIYYISILLLSFLYLKLMLKNLKEAILAGFIFTQFSLGALPWEIIPLDGIAFATQLFFIFFTVIYFIKRKYVSLTFIQNKYTISIMLLASLVIFYLYLSDNTLYGISKTIFFILKGVLPVFALGMLYPYNEKDKQLILKVIIIGSFLMAIKLYAFGDTFAERATVSDQASSISVARTIGFGSTILLGYLLLKPKLSFINVLIGLGFLVVCFFAVLITGTRGPLLSIFFASFLIILLFSTKGIRLKIIAKLLIMLLMIGIGINVFQSDKIKDSFYGINRIIYYTTTIGKNTSDRGRIERYNVALNGIFETGGLGVGTGGFATLYGVEGRDYPHNIFLEIMVEQGIMGVIAFILTLWVPFSKIISCKSKYRKDSIYPFIVAVWFYALFNSFVSFDISGNHLLWLSGGMVYFLNCKRLTFLKEVKNERINDFSSSTSNC